MKFAVALVALLAVGAFAAAPAPAPAAAAGVTDADILIFALNLECLEAQFYSYAAFGVGLTPAQTGNGPAVVGGQKALLSPAMQAMATSIAMDEINHVTLLRAALGAAAPPCPLINIGSAFSLAADAALNATLSPEFSPYGDDVTFLHGAFIFEDVGVTAYLGAAPLIASKAYLGVAAGILAVEAYHAGAIRQALSTIALDYVFPYGAQVQTIVDAISALRGAVGGGADSPLVTNVTVASLPAPTGAVATQSIPSSVETIPVVAAANSTTSVAFNRSPDEVLEIVYLGSAMGGGFFPNGLNGNIK